MIEIDRALTDQRLLGPALGDSASWSTWIVVLRAAFGLSLDERELELFATVAGDRKPPSQRVRELWCVAGRRSGKSHIAAALAVFLALFAKHKLSRGDRKMCLVISGSVDQSKTVFNYIRGFLEAARCWRRRSQASRGMR